MAIFTPSLDDRKTKAKLMIASQVNSIFNQLKISSLGIKKSIWHNPDPELTPAIILEVLGSEGAKLFALSSAVSTLLNGAIPNTIDLTPEQPITVNEDGTVTLTPAS